MLTCHRRSARNTCETSYYLLERIIKNSAELDNARRKHSCEIKWESWIFAMLSRCRRINGINTVSKGGRGNADGARGESRYVGSGTHR
jgi:hypothetical protein